MAEPRRTRPNLSANDDDCDTYAVITFVHVVTRSRQPPPRSNTFKTYKCFKTLKRSSIVYLVTVLDL
jgi:hypothetical protein